MANRTTTNVPIPSIETTIKYFEKVYNTPIQISQNVMDIMYSFFIERAENEQAALAMVHGVIVTAIDHRIEPLEVLEEFQQYDDLRLDARLSVFLNLSRNNTSLLGVSNNPSVNYHIGRAILP